MIFISGKLKRGASRLLKLIVFRANTVSQAQLFTVSHMTYTLVLWWSACLLITFPCRWVEQNISSTGVFPQLNSTLPQTFSGFSFVLCATQHVQIHTCHHYWWFSPHSWVFLCLFLIWYQDKLVFSGLHPVSSSFVTALEPNQSAENYIKTVNY